LKGETNTTLLMNIPVTTCTRDRTTENARKKMNDSKFWGDAIRFGRKTMEKSQ